MEESDKQYLFEIDKQTLVEEIKEWIQLDNEIKMLNSELRKRRYRKKELTKSLTRFMKSSETDKFETKQGNLNYGTQKKIQTIGKRFLIQTIGTYFSDDPYLAKDVIEYVLENRQVKEEDVIRMYIPKKKNKKIEDDASVYTENTENTAYTYDTYDTNV